MSRDLSTIITEIVLDTFAEELRDNSAFRNRLTRRLRPVTEDIRREARDEIRLSETNDLPDF